MIDKLAVIGVGLIGGSFCLAMRAAGRCRSIYGYDLDLHNMRQAQELGVIDVVCTDLQEAIADASLIVFAVPSGALESLFQQLAGHLPAQAILTDVTSIKQPVIAMVAKCLPEHLSNFVPAHPVAGTEQNGVAAARPDLFLAHRVILTPTSATSIKAVKLVQELWQAIGADVIQIDAEHHDRVLAATSHLPHLLAYALVESLAALPEREEVFQFAAGGFADFTRIASSSPIMWHDIFLQNKSHMLAALTHFEQTLQTYKKIILEQDSEVLQQHLNAVKKIRDNFSDRRMRDR